MKRTFGIPAPHVKLFQSIFLRSSVIGSAFIIFLISSYLYGPEGRGVISFLTSFYLTLSLLLSFGLGRVAYQRISISQEDAKTIFEVMQLFIAAVSLIVLLLMIPALWLLSLWNIEQFQTIHFLLFFLMFPYYIWQNISNFLFSAVQKSEVQDRLVFTTRAVQLLILGGSIVFHIKIEAFLFLYGISCFITFIIESITLKNRIGSKFNLSLREYIAEFKKLFKEIRWPYIDSIAQSAAPFCVFILGLHVDQRDLGHYNFALQILAALAFPLAVFQLKLQEKFATSLEDNGARLIRRSFVNALPFSVVLGLFGLLIPPVIHRVGLSNFDESIPMLQALLFTLPLFAATTVFQSIWVGKHRAHLSSLINLTIAGINILIVLFLAQEYGVQAGIWGTYISGLIGVIVQSVVLKKQWDSLTMTSVEQI